MAYITELEEASKRAAQTESERNKTLEIENAELRNGYLNLRRKVLGVICTLEEVSEEAGKRLKLTSAFEQELSGGSASECGDPQTIGEHRQGVTRDSLRNISVNCFSPPSRRNWTRTSRDMQSVAW